MFSFDECVPNRPPRLAEVAARLRHRPADETPNGRVSTVTSMIRSICRFSKHSLAIVSPTTAMKFAPRLRLVRPARTRRDRGRRQPRAGRRAAVF